jgi:hypothetical protein
MRPQEVNDWIALGAVYVTFITAGIWLTSGRKFPWQK